MVRNTLILEEVMLFMKVFGNGLMENLLIIPIGPIGTSNPMEMKVKTA